MSRCVCQVKILVNFMCREPTACHRANHNDLIMYMLHLPDTVKCSTDIADGTKGDGISWYVLPGPGGPKGGPGPNNITYVLIFLGST